MGTAPSRSTAADKGSTDKGAGSCPRPNFVGDLVRVPRAFCHAPPFGLMMICCQSKYRSMPDQFSISVLHSVQGPCSLVALYHIPHFGHSNRSVVHVPLVSILTVVVAVLVAPRIIGGMLTPGGMLWLYGRAMARRDHRRAMVARVQKSASQARDDAALARGGIDAGRLEAAAIGIFGDSDDPTPTMAREQRVKYVRSNPPLDASLIAAIKQDAAERAELFAELEVRGNHIFPASDNDAERKQWFARKRRCHLITPIAAL